MVLTGRLVISSLKSKRLPHWTLCGQVKHPTFALSLLRIGKKTTNETSCSGIYTRARKWGAVNQTTCITWFRVYFFLEHALAWQCPTECNLAAANKARLHQIAHIFNGLCVENDSWATTLTYMHTDRVRRDHCVMKCKPGHTDAINH
jgi:hypothetical protein